MASRAQPSAAVSIVVPTYREADNVGPLITRIATTMAGCARPWEVVVTEDQSHDTTVDTARRASVGLPVRVVVRKQDPRELSANLLHGLGHARHALVVVMDADRSHRPEDIPRLLDALADGADMSVGCAVGTGSPRTAIPPPTDKAGRRPPQKAGQGTGIRLTSIHRNLSARADFCFAAGGV